MSADRLREAARVLRGQATAATNAVGPTAWARQGEDWNESDGVTHTVASAEYAAAGALYEEVADYIATVDPLVGLALADWLDSLVGRVNADNTVDANQSDIRHALTLADLILGTPTNCEGAAMTTEKLVTHADREMLHNLRRDLLAGDSETGLAWMDEDSPRARLIDRLIAAAEADAPPLPEGWVSIEPSEVREGDILSVYYQGRDDHEGHRYTGRVTESVGVFSITDAHLDFLAVYLTSLGESPDGVADFRRLTPLRPTVSEADVEKAAKSLYDAAPDEEWPSYATADAKSHARNEARKAFKAAGVEVAP